MNAFQKFIKWTRRPNKSTFMQYVETFVVVLPIAFFVRTYFYGLYQVPTGSMETTMLVGGRFVADKFTPLFTDFKRGDIISFNAPDFKYSENKLMRLFQHYVWGPQNWTKRVIGIPGDHIKGVIEDGVPVVYLNGKKLDEPYVNKYPLIGVYRNGELEYRSYDPSIDYEKQPFYKVDRMSVRLGKKLFEQQSYKPILMPFTPAYKTSSIYDIKTIDNYDVVLGPNQYWAMGDNRQGSLDSRVWGPLDGSLIHGKIIFCIFSLDTDESWWIVDLIKHPIDFWTKHMRWDRFFTVVR